MVWLSNYVNEQLHNWSHSQTSFDVFAPERIEKKRPFKEVKSELLQYQPPLDGELPFATAVDSKTSVWPIKYTLKEDRLKNKRAFTQTKAVLY